MFKNKDLFFVVFICLLFISFVMPNLYYLGCNNDESARGLCGIYFLQNKNAGIGSTVVIRLFGKIFPIDYNESHTFALPCYLLIPSFMIFGINVFALKLPSIIFSLLTLPVLYYVCKTLFNRRVAIITTLLLSLNPVFIHYTRTGMYTLEPILNFFFIAGIFFFIQYYYKKRNLYLYLASYLLGAGLSVKLSFASRLLGLFFAIAVFFPKKALNFINTKIRARQKFAVIIFFCLGAFLFIYFNIVARGETFKWVKYLYTDIPTYGGTSNTHFIDNLKIRLAQLKQVTTEQFFDSPVSNDELYPPGYHTIRENIFKLLIAAFISNLAFVFLLKRHRLELKLLLSIYLLYIIMFFTSCFTPRTMSPFHLALLYPFPQLIVAVFISYLSLAISRIYLNPLLKKLVISIVSLAIILPLILFDARTMITYHSVLRKTGGRESWSPVLYDIVAYVKENKLNQYPIACFGEFGVIITFITKSELNRDYELFLDSPENRQSSFDRLGSILSKTNRFYFISAIYEDKPAAAFKQYIINLNKKITLEKTFYNKGKEPQYYLYRVE
jgi:hypothetical protein